MKQSRLPLLVLFLFGCTEEQSSVPSYNTASLERASINVSVGSTGIVEPLAIVEVKSKASGEILELFVETGDFVEEGDLLVHIDPRTVRNRLAQAEAGLKAAVSRRQISQTQMKRAEVLVKNGTFTEIEHEKAILELANAEAQVISAEVEVENARIAVEDTDVRAPITGTVIAKPAEKGQVISSPTQDFAGGTLLMSTADLSAVQIRALIDETDIGKVRSGMKAEITVAAFPNQPFLGDVNKIEPKAVVEQNVTMFAVLMSIQNPEGLLMPGMNAEVEVSIAARENVLSLPIMALRTDRDIPTTASLLGLVESDLRREILADSGRQTTNLTDGTDTETVLLGGRSVELPTGTDTGRIRTIMTKRRAGEALSREEEEFVRGALSSGRSPSRPVKADGMTRGAPGADSGTDYRFGGDFWVVVQEVNGNIRTANVRAGITDLDRVEIVSGLDESDTVLILPSAHLVETQQELQQAISRRIGSVIPGLGNSGSTPGSGSGMTGGGMGGGMR